MDAGMLTARWIQPGSYATCPPYPFPRLWRGSGCAKFVRLSLSIGLELREALPALIYESDSLLIVAAVVPDNESPNAFPSLAPVRHTRTRTSCIQ